MSSHFDVSDFFLILLGMLHLNQLQFILGSDNNNHHLFLSHQNLYVQRQLLMIALYFKIFTFSASFSAVAPTLKLQVVHIHLKAKPCIVLSQLF